MNFLVIPFEPEIIFIIKEMLIELEETELLSYYDKILKKKNITKNIHSLKETKQLESHFNDFRNKKNFHKKVSAFIIANKYKLGKVEDDDQ